MRPHPKVEQIDALFRQTLSAGYDGDRPWSAIRRLHRMGLRIIFEKAAAWSISDSWLKRARAADILCQIHSREIIPPRRSSTPLFVDESFAILSRMLAAERNEFVQASVLFGFNHLSVEAAIPLVLPFVHHANADVRFAATHALGSFPHNPQAVEALQILADDPDKDCRNWALFAIGTQSDLDTPNLRWTLVRHLHDPYRDAMEEAIAGLAKRNDERAVVPLFHLLRSGSYFRHNESSLAIILATEKPAEGWNADNMLDALYVRFPNLLPTR